jgi:hypothetical protein
MTTPSHEHPYRRVADRLAENDPQAGRELHQTLDRLPSLEQTQVLIDQGNRLIEQLEEQRTVLRSHTRLYVAIFIVVVVLVFVSALRILSRGVA